MRATQGSISAAFSEHHNTKMNPIKIKKNIMSFFNIKNKTTDSLHEGKNLKIIEKFKKTKVVNASINSTSNDLRRKSKLLHMLTKSKQ